MKHVRWSRALLVLVVAFVHAVAAQPTGVVPEAGLDLGAAEIQARLTALESEQGLDETTRDSAKELYRGALDELRRANDFGAQAAEFRRLTQEAPERLRLIREELASPPTEVSPVAPAGSTLAQLEQTLGQVTADLNAARQSANDLQTEASKRNERRTTLPEQIARVRRLLADSEDPGALSAREGEPVALTEARRALLLSQRFALQREIDSLEAEAASYDARRDLLPARRDREQRRIAEAERLVAAWQVIVTAQRISEADTAAREAQRLRRETARQHPVLKGFAAETAERAGARAGAQSIAERIDRASREASDTHSALAALRGQFASIQRRLDVSGLNRATGLLLRRQYETLPDKAELRRRIRVSQEALEDAEYALVELQEERLSAGDIDRVAQELVAEIPTDESTTSVADLEQVARELATARRDLLDQYIADAGTYFERNADLNTVLREYEGESKQYRMFIEERILWVRSIAGDRFPSAGDFRSSVRWLFRVSDWSSALSETTRYLRSRWVTSTLLLVVFVALLAHGLSCRRRVYKLGELVSKYQTDAFVHTLAALVYTVLLAAPASLALYAAGWILSQPPGQPGVAVAIGAGMQSTALLLFPLSVLRQLLRPRGVAEAHFRWPHAAVRSIRVHLRWFLPTVTPLLILVTAIDRDDNEALNASLGRTLFTIGLLVLSVFLFRVLRPSGPALRRLLHENQRGWAHRFRHVWFPLTFLAPVVFAVLSWLGFHYTALQLESRLEDSLVLVFALVLANSLMMRWLFIARRRIAIEDARRRRAQAASEAETRRAAGESALTVDAGAVIDEDKVDLPALSAQTRQLFRAAITVSVVVGLSLIWAQAMPALRMLDRVQIWPSVTLTAGAEPGRDARTDAAVAEQGTTTEYALPGTIIADTLTDDTVAASTPAVTPPLTITLADLGFALIVLIVTAAAFQNVPGLVEIVVLQRLPLDAGSRYALSTVLRYSIVIVGVLIAFQTVGISWAKVQWLAAALTFGLAFGLQEIFANFVSGLIILAERPIRLGDTVTVSGVTGTVTRIRMRATTIMDWDMKELVIPNKTFITGDVINWSLSDSVLRLSIPVGVSYSSDVDKVESLLLSTAKANKIVLANPKPQVIFKTFGDSTLDFELRVFVPSIDHFVPMRHEMHMTIIKAFRKAGVEIAFPQRDLHIRSIDDLDRLSPRPELVDRPSTVEPVAKGTRS